MIIDTIKNEIKSAMIQKDEKKKNVLRMVLDKANAEAKKNSLKNKTNVEDELTDDVCLTAINMEMNQLKQTIKALEDVNKTESDLYKESLEKKSILEVYLPKQLTEEELKTEIEAILNEVDTSNKGLVMKTVMAKLKNKAEGKTINAMVNEMLKR